MNHEINLRDATAAHWPAILNLNATNVPAVSEIDMAELEDLAKWSTRLRVAMLGDEVVGFMILLGPGLSYKSMNYAWFTQRYPQFLYVDRIALGPSTQRRGVGRRLYREAAALAAANQGPLLCEVNIKPRNETSLAFHKALGFVPVGEQDTEDGKRVVMLALETGLQVEAHTNHGTE